MRYAIFTPELEAMSAKINLSQWFVGRAGTLIQNFFSTKNFVNHPWLSLNEHRIKHTTK